MTAPSPVPTRRPSGFQTDPPYGPLANLGVVNPFFYHSFADDFSDLPTGKYTVTNLSTGSVALLAGDGGLLKLLTAATSNDTEVVTLPTANFQLPQGTTIAKKLAYLVRLQLSDITASGFIVGLCATETTPFGGVTDGIWFSKATGGTVLDINTASGSTVVTTAIPTAAYSFVNATNIDLGFYIDTQGNLNAFVGAQLVGYLPQSGTGGVNSSGVPTLPVIGRCLQIASGWTVSAAILNPTLALKAGAAAAKSMTVDFHGAWKER